MKFWKNFGRYLKVTAKRRSESGPEPLPPPNARTCRALSHAHANTLPRTRPPTPGSCCSQSPAHSHGRAAFSCDCQTQGQSPAPTPAFCGGTGPRRCSAAAAGAPGLVPSLAPQSAGTAPPPPAGAAEKRASGGREGVGLRGVAAPAERQKRPRAPLSLSLSLLTRATTTTRTCRTAEQRSRTHTHSSSGADSERRSRHLTRPPPSASLFPSLAGSAPSGGHPGGRQQQRRPGPAPALLLHQVGRRPHLAQGLRGRHDGCAIDPGG